MTFRVEAVGRKARAEMEALARMPFNSAQCHRCGMWVPLRYL